MQDHNLRSEATSGIITADVRLIHLMLMLLHNLHLYWKYVDEPSMISDYTLTSIKLHTAHLNAEINRYIDSKDDPVWDDTVEKEFCKALKDFDVDWDLEDLARFCINHSVDVQQIKDRLTQKDRRNLDILQARFLSPLKKGR